MRYCVKASGAVALIEKSSFAATSTVCAGLIGSPFCQVAGKVAGTTNVPSSETLTTVICALSGLVFGSPR